MPTLRSNLWKPHVAFEDLAINRKHSDVNSGVALKESKGKHQLMGCGGQTWGLFWVQGSLWITLVSITCQT